MLKVFNANMRRQAEMFNVVNGELVLRRFRRMDRIQTNFLTQNVLRNVFSDLAPPARFLPPIVRSTRRLLRSGFGSALRVGPISTVTVGRRRVFFQSFAAHCKLCTHQLRGPEPEWTWVGSIHGLSWVGSGWVTIFLFSCVASKRQISVFSP